jgi:hypothetical protein
MSRQIAMASRGRRSGPRGTRVALIVGSAFAVTAFAGVTIALRPSPPPPIAESGLTPPAPARRETRPTLDPARFTGQAAAAYQVAREIPDVLDQLHCYCACGNQYGHGSLLSCYTDGHGAT